MSSINRYKFKDADIVRVKKYLKSGTGNAPNWAKKFKGDLSVKGNTVFYKGKEIVTQENMDDWLRKKIMGKEAAIPFGRDSAYYKLNCIGVPRRKLMEWLRAQKTLAESKPKLAKPKVQAGKKYKKITLQSDLVFVRRPDVIKANKKFQNDELKLETYIICTTEVNSGLTRCDYLQSKSETNSALERHIKYFMKMFQVSGKQMKLETDAGSEYSQKRIKKLIPDYKFVSSGKYVERKNSQIQANLFRLLKNRQATTLKEAVAKAETMANNTLNRIHKKTPLEVVQEVSNEDIIKKHNSTRKTYQKGDTRGEFQVGDFVRIQADEKTLSKMDYKVYKSKTFSDTVRKITHKTKKSNPAKYRVSGRWYLQSRLTKAQPVDDKSEALKKTRDDELKNKDAAARKDQLEYVKAADVAKEADRKAGFRVLRKREEFVKKLQAQREKEDAIDKIIEAAEKRKLPKAAMRLKQKLKKKRSKRYEDDEDWVP